MNKRTKFKLKLGTSIAGLAGAFTALGLLIGSFIQGAKVNDTVKDIDAMMNNMPEFHQFIADKQEGIETLFQEEKISEDIKEDMLNELNGKNGYVMFFKENANHAKKTEYEQKLEKATNLEDSHKALTTAGCATSTASLFVALTAHPIINAIKEDDELDY